jgi:putative ABC transport system permease protein
MFRQNLTYALRTLRRSPGFTATAVLTLALGVGANTAIFSVLNAVLLRPLPFGQPDRLVWGWGKTTGVDIAGISPVGFRDYRAQNRAFDQFAAMEVFVSDTPLTGNQKPEQVRVGIVSSNFFDALGLIPLAGRGFVATDEEQNLPQVAVLGRGFWQQHFGGSPSVIGKTVILDGNPVVIVGVLPDASMVLNAEVWMPTPILNPGMSLRASHFMRVVARLKAGTTLEKAQADLDGIAQRLGEQYPDSDKGWSIRLQSLSDVLVGKVKNALLILWCAVGLVLLIACANVANLLLVRASGREKEVAIRAALGANRGILIRGVLTESLLLAMAGGVVALLLALWGVEALRIWGPADLPRLNEIRVDGAVLGFALLLSLVTGLIFGIAPAIHAASGDLQTPLKAGARANRKPHHRGAALVVAEIAISLVLLVSAGLAVKSLWRLVHVDPGFQPQHTVTTAIGFAQSTQRQRGQRSAFLTQLFARIEAMPGIESAGAVSELPLMGLENDGAFRAEGKVYSAATGPGSFDVAIDHRVAGDYFQAMGVPLLKGRYLSSLDRADTEPVVVISEPFAQRYFPGMDPIGKHLLSYEASNVTREIVGVVGGVKFNSLGTPAFSEMYFPFYQHPGSAMNIVVRTKIQAADIGSALRSAVAAINPDQPISALRTMDEIISGAAAQPRFYSLLLGLFAMVAIALSAIGLYGVISYAVSQHTREIGIRLALGATSADIARLVAGQGLRFTAIGLLAGLAGAWFASRLLSSYLFGVMPHDASTFLFLPLLLAGVALAASWIPVRRAMRVDPSVSLREP